jgi:predicted transcriptional regulator
MTTQRTAGDRFALLQGTFNLLILRKRPQSTVYSLTPKGREQLVEKTSEWQRLTE